jgi:hypothetical protein
MHALINKPLAVAGGFRVVHLTEEDMGDQSELDEENLVVEFLFEQPALSQFQRRLYEMKLDYIKQLIDIVDFIANPSAQDVKALLQEVLALGITQKGLAGQFGVTTGTLSRWVSGENPPREFARVGIVRDLKDIIAYSRARLVSAPKERRNSPARRSTGARRSRPHARNSLHA